MCHEGRFRVRNLTHEHISGVGAPSGSTTRGDERTGQPSQPPEHSEGVLRGGRPGRGPIPANNKTRKPGSRGHGPRETDFYPFLKVPACVPGPPFLARREVLPPPGGRPGGRPAVGGPDALSEASGAPPGRCAAKGSGHGPEPKRATWEGVSTRADVPLYLNRQNPLRKVGQKSDFFLRHFSEHFSEGFAKTPAFCR